METGCRGPNVYSLHGRERELGDKAQNPAAEQVTSWHGNVWAPGPCGSRVGALEHS